MLKNVTQGKNATWPEEKETMTSHENSSFIILIVKLNLLDIVEDLMMRCVLRFKIYNHLDNLW